MSNGEKCALCPGSCQVHRNRRHQDLLLCKNCKYREENYAAMTDAEAKDKAHKLIGNLLCMVLARKGHDAALDASVLLLAALEGD